MMVSRAIGSTIQPPPRRACRRSRSIRPAMNFGSVISTAMRFPYSPCSVAESLRKSPLLADVPFDARLDPRQCGARHDDHEAEHHRDGRAIGPAAIGEGFVVHV